MNKSRLTSYKKVHNYIYMYIVQNTCLSTRLLTLVYLASRPTMTTTIAIKSRPPKPTAKPSSHDRHLLGPVLYHLRQRVQLHKVEDKSGGVCNQDMLYSHRKLGSCHRCNWGYYLRCCGIVDVAPLYCDTVLASFRYQ